VVGLPAKRLQQPPSDITSRRLGDAAEAFIYALQLSGASRLTIKSYRAALQSFLSYVGVDRAASNVKAEDYIAWLTAMRSRGPMGPRGGRWSSTVHYYSVFVRRFLSWLGVSGLPSEPSRRGEFSGALSWRDVEAMMSKARDLYDLLIVSLMAESGLRAREVVGLTWGDIDLARGEARVRGKYGKERTVVLGQVARAVLSALPPGQPNERVVKLSYQAIYDRVKSMARRAGIDVSRVRPHVLRHTFATEALRRGMSLPVLQRLLGHSDIRITQVYLHLLDEDVRREYERAFMQPQQPYYPPYPPQAYPPYVQPGYMGAPGPRG
jgi:integrase/recombinase XerD